MKESKKFTLGSIHENGAGKFEILDRYEEDGIVYLKYQYIDSGEVITNKEVNVNASIWKFLKVRGLAGSGAAPIKAEVTDEIKALQDRIEELEETVKMQQSQITSILKLISER